MVNHPDDMKEIEKEIGEEESNKKKRILLFSVGFIGFLIPITFVILMLTGVFNRQNQMNQSAANPHASYTVAKEKQTLKKDGSNWDFHTEGNVKNDGNVVLAYVLVTVDLFDQDGVKIDYGLFNTGRLEVDQVARWTVNAYLDVKPATYNVHIDWLRQY